MSAQRELTVGTGLYPGPVPGTEPPPQKEVNCRCCRSVVLATQGDRWISSKGELYPIWRCPVCDHLHEQLAAEGGRPVPLLRTSEHGHARGRCEIGSRG